MDYKTHHPSTPTAHRDPSLAAKVWTLTAAQHGVVARRQLLILGMHSQAITHRIANGRLHRVAQGVYAVGRPELTQEGKWMTAVLACGPDAFLSHFSAAQLSGWGVERHGTIEVSIHARTTRRRPGISVHRRKRLSPSETTSRQRIPVTSPLLTLIDVAPAMTPTELERAINELAKLKLLTPFAIRTGLTRYKGRRGVPRITRILDRQTFAFTDSELEQHFLPLVRRAGLAKPQTGTRLNGFTVDFYWPELGLVVETDSLRFHRTPAQQLRDHRRDQAHSVAGLTPLRFTHGQINYEPAEVVGTLERVAARLSAN